MVSPLRYSFSGLLSCLLLAGCAGAEPVSEPTRATAAAPVTASPASSSGRGSEFEKEGVAPEAATGRGQQRSVWHKRHMAVAANAHASRAGREILRAGGSAVDAAIAMALVLTLVEPQSSGIGGGAFMLHLAGKTGQLVSYDGRETAPAAATPDMFMKGAHPRKFFDAVVGGLSVGAPGMLRMCEMAHRAHGRLPWARLFDNAIALAEQGFIVSERLAQLVAGDRFLPKMPAARRYFFEADGRPRAAGTRLVNRPLAQVLREVARGGANAFYEGAIARDLVAAVRGAKPLAGRLREGDLKAYRARRRDPACLPYKRYRICGMAPPSSGGITTLQIFGLLQHQDLRAAPPGSLLSAHYFAEAGRLAFADRALYLADPDFATIPKHLLEAGYLRQRARAIAKHRSMGKASAGIVPKLGLQYAPDASLELPSTSHLVVVDERGNTVSMTASIESAFGSRLMVRGFLLNNELTDFSFVAEADGRLVANRVQPGKRPRSSMAPTIVVDEKGRLLLAVGSPGGSRIIPFVAQVLRDVLVHGLDIQAAIDRPHVANRNGPTELEGTGSFAPWAKGLRPGLEGLGHEVVVRDMNSGLHGIMRQRGGWAGGADPRREGLAVGD